MRKACSKFKTKKSVCILSTVHPAFDVRVFHKEAKTLACADFDVTLIAQHGRDEKVEGINIIRLPEPQNRFHRILALTWHVLCLGLKQRATIYHFHDPELLTVGLLLKLLTRSKVVYDVHEDVAKDILIKDWLPSLMRVSIAKFTDFIEKQIARHLDAIVPATEAIAYSFKKPKPVVIHNYPDSTLVPRADSFQGEEDKFVLVYVGGIDRSRGVVEMVRAFEYFPTNLKVRLELIGKFELTSLEAELQALPGYQHVNYIGWLPWESARRRVQNAHVGLALLHSGPTYTVSLPIKLFEYMAASLPIVASNFPLWKKIVEGNKCGLTVDPRSPREIAQAIEYLLTHPKEAREMGENGRRAVLDRYNWECEAKKLLDLYNQLLNG